MLRDLSLAGFARLVLSLVLAIYLLGTARLAAAQEPETKARLESSASVEATPADDSRRPGHALSFGAEAGPTYWTEKGPIGTANSVGLALVPGYHVGVRTNFEVLPWLALGTRGLVMRNVGNASVSGGSVTTLGGFVTARFMLPLEHIHPYALIGFGGYHLFASGAQTQLLSGTYTAFEPGLGAAVPVGRRFEVGVEYFFNVLLAEKLSSNPKFNGGDPSTISFFLQYRLPL